MNAGDSDGFRRRRRGHGGPSASRGAAPGVAPGTLAGTSPGGGPGELKRSLVETALLIALIEESRHGYALVERVEELVGHQVYVDAGSVYRILRLLEQAGVVTSVWEAGVSGPQRRTYTVEPYGRELLLSWAGVLAQRGAALIDLSKLALDRIA